MKPLPIPSVVARSLAFAALCALLLGIYAAAIRPAQLRWGATAEEAARVMPGDELVAHPSFLATRAITIQGSPEAIWPWLVQMGYGRAGFYGYDLIENIGSPSGIESASAILPALQHPRPGDALPISAVARLRFGDIQPERYLLWQSETNPPDSAFTWALDPIGPGQTRLVSRIRLRYHPGGQALALDLFTEFADHVAVPKILRGLKDRVEGRPPEPLVLQAALIAVWVVALGELLTVVFLLFRWREWGRAWLLGLAAGLVLQFALYSHGPVWMGAVLVGCMGGALFATARGSAAIGAK